MIILLGFPAVSLWAQSGIITGKIIDEQGDPLIGATVTLDEDHGTVTDTYGRYRLITEPGKVDLAVSFIGYEQEWRTLDVAVSERVNSDFKLVPSSLRLEDVVITSGNEDILRHVSSYDIQLRPIQSSQEVLRFVPGLFIAQHAGGGKAEQIFLRGFDIDHGTDITLSVDGMPVNMVSHAHGQGYSDLHFLIPEIVENVDFNKGPYYAEQGNFNTAGYAAFETLKALDQSSVKIEGGQFNTLRTVALIDLLGDRRTNSDFYLASEIYLTDGYFESDQDFTRLNVFGKYTSRISPMDHLTLSASTFHSSWDASGQIPERAVESGEISRFGAIDDTEGGMTSRSNFNIRYRRMLSSDAYMSHQMYYTRYDFTLFSNFTFFLNDPVNGDQIRQEEERNLYGYSGKYLRVDHLKNILITSEATGGIRMDDINNIRLSRTRNRSEILKPVADGNVDEINLFASLTETFDLHRFTITGALRLDHFIQNYTNLLESFDNASTVSRTIVSPKVRINYQINPRASLFAKLGTGFHSNDSRTVAVEQVDDILPKAYGADLGITIKPLPELLLSSSFWMLDLEQEFVYVGDEGIVELSGPTRRMGVDMSVRYQPVSWFFVDIDLNFTRPRAREEAKGEDYIPLAPTISSVGGIGLQSKNGFSGSLRYRYLYDRPANEENSLTADGYLLVDAVVKYSWRNVEFGLSAENLLNSAWKEAQFETTSRLRDEPDEVSEIHFTPGTPFALRASVRISF